MGFIQKYVNSFTNQTWYENVFLFSTILIFVLYAYTYLMAQKSEKEREYIPLLITVRTLILASFLIFFYNPFRTSYEYGHALPLFAFSAGITLLMLTDKYDILNLAHFILYGTSLPPNPKKVCTLEQDIHIRT